MRETQARIAVHAEWRYSDSDECVCCPGRHAFYRGGRVTKSDVPHWIEGFADDIASHGSRAVERLGDGADIEIIVRRVDQATTSEN